MSTCKCQGEGDKDAEIFVSKVKFGPQRAKSTVATAVVVLIVAGRS